MTDLNTYIEKQIAAIRELVGSKDARGRVLLGLSGGVDSSVCAAMIAKAVPGQLTCVFVDHGFMRKNEGDEIEAAFANKDLQLIRVNAQERFLAKLAGVTDPEAKRKLIGEEFVRVFEQTSFDLFSSDESAKIFLAQGTIYPDIVESDGIKSHHNVGGLPEDLQFAGLVEPLRELYKDDVRKVGLLLGLPEALVNRQPFPGPGLAVRVIGEVTFEKLEALREADAIFREELSTADVPVAQSFAIMTDTYSVGIKDGKRTYNPVVALRAVETNDFMTCRAVALSPQFLERVAARITDEIATVSRVVYDITSKPPGTIEWE